MFTVCIHVWWGASWCSNDQYHLYHGCSGAPFITTLHFLPVSSCRLDSDFLIKINSLWVFGHPACQQQQQQQQCGPRSRAHSCGRAALRLPELCCVPLSTAGSAVGPCGGAGRTVRRCLSAASSRKASFSLSRRTENRQVDPNARITHPPPLLRAEGAERSCGGGRRRRRRGGTAWCGPESPQGRWH